MATARASSPARRPLLARRNLIILSIAVLALVAGYAVLDAGHPTPASVLLVLGYCVLFPLGIAL
jgi:hypothetical protein